jgi:hypothetical protein
MQSQLESVVLGLACKSVHQRSMRCVTTTESLMSSRGYVQPCARTHTHKDAQCENPDAIDMGTDRALVSDARVLFVCAERVRWVHRSPNVAVLGHGTNTTSLAVR